MILEVEVPAVMQSRISDNIQGGCRSYHRDLQVSYQRTLRFISLPEQSPELELSGNKISGNTSEFQNVLLPEMTVFPYPVRDMTLLRPETQPAQPQNYCKTFTLIVLCYCFNNPQIFFFFNSLLMKCQGIKGFA